MGPVKPSPSRVSRTGDRLTAILRIAGYPRRFHVLSLTQCLPRCRTCEYDERGSKKKEGKQRSRREKERTRERANERTKEEERKTRKRSYETRVRSRTRESFDWAFNPRSRNVPSLLVARSILSSILHARDETELAKARKLRYRSIPAHRRAVNSRFTPRGFSSPTSSIVVFVGPRVPTMCTTDAQRRITVDTNHSSLLSTGGDKTPLPVGRVDRFMANDGSWQKRRCLNIFTNTHEYPMKSWLFFKHCDQLNERVASHDIKNRIFFWLLKHFVT